MFAHTSKGVLESVAFESIYNIGFNFKIIRMRRGPIDQGNSINKTIMSRKLGDGTRL